MVMMTTLYEHWHSETWIFHLMIGEMTVTLEDVYKIFLLPILGILVTTMREVIAERVLH